MSECSLTRLAPDHFAPIGKVIAFMKLRRTVAATLVSVSVLAAVTNPALATEAPAAIILPPAEVASPAPAPVLTLDQALTLAEANNPGLRLASYQLIATRATAAAAPANAAAVSPAVSTFLQVQYGLTVPEEAITPQAAGQQSVYSYEQAVAQYYSARQQVRAGALQAYVEWQKAVALVEAQQAALDRVLTQEGHVKTAIAVGTAAQYDLLQIQAAVAGQQAALIGAQAMEAGARYGLEQVIGSPLLPNAQPAPNQIRSADVTLPTDLNALLAKALTNRPDLREQSMNLASRRLQAGLSTAAAVMQLQIVATQYEMATAQARMEVQQALLSARGALEELKAREAALEPAREALRLAELRHDAGLATLVEVQGASAALLQAEASRIQAAANLSLRLLQLRQATGEL